MKTISKLFLISILFVFAGMMSLQAQVTVTTSGAGVVILPVDVPPTVDLVTKGTTVPYLVYPDPILNPTWLPTTGGDAKNTTGIISNWTWTIPATIGSTSVTTHYMELSIAGAVGATGNIDVKENSGAACAGTTTTIPVKIVAAPNITAGSVTNGTGTPTSICSGGTAGALAEPFPQYKVTAVTDASIPVATVLVKATLTFIDLLGASSNLFVDKILAVDALGNVSNVDLATALGVGVFNNWGTYNLKVTEVSDKISRKDASALKGYFTLTTPTTAVYSVFKAPKTGAIYHLAN